MTSRWTVLGAPLDSSGAGRGEEHAPAALRAAGLTAALGASDGGDVAPPLRGPERDPATGVIALDGLVRASEALCEAVSGQLERGVRPLVVGGDCTLLLGAIAGARESAGRIGMWFVDGHADYLDGSSSPTGEAADMELAMLTGDGPAELLDLFGDAPALRPEDVVLLGHRPPDLDVDVGMELARLPRALPRMSADEISLAGPAGVGGRWERELAERGPAWLHLDLDVLDQADLPAVSYPQAHGLSWDGLVALTRPLLTSDALLGVSVADFNPDLDPDGRHAHRVVEALAEAVG